MRRPSLAFICITIFIDILGYSMIVPLLPFFVHQNGGGAAIAGSLGSLYALLQLFSGPVLGSLSDRVGRKPILLACLLGTALAYSLFGLANSLGGLYLAVFLDGLTGNNLTTAYAYVADITPSTGRARGLSLVGAAFGLGLMAGPALGGLLSAYGLAVPAFAAALAALFNVVYGLVFLPESLPVEKRQTHPVSFNALGQLAELFALRPVRYLLGALFVMNLAFSGLQTNFPLFSHARFNWDGRQNGLFFAFVGVVAVFGQGILYGWVQPRLGERRLAQLGLLCLSAGLAGIALARDAWQLFPSVALAALGSGASIPSLSGLVSNTIGHDQQGRLMGGTQALLSLTNILGPALAGITFELIAVNAPYWLGCLLAASAVWITRRALTSQ